MLLVTGFLTVEWEQLRASLLCLSKLVLQAQKTTSQAHAQKLKKKVPQHCQELPSEHLSRLNKEPDI